MKTRSVTSKSAARPRRGAARRSYESPLREKQAEATRQLILDALVSQLAALGLRDFSLPQVAERAGVTTRTIYRYFPTREALLEAVEVEVARRVMQLPPQDDLDQLTRWVEPMFSSFEQNAPLMRALIRADPAQDMGRVRASGRRKRAENFARCLAAELPDMDPRRRHCAAALVHYLFSAGAWDALQQVWGLTPEESAETVRWALATLIAELRRENAPKGKTRRPNHRTETP